MSKMQNNRKNDETSIIIIKKQKKLRNLIKPGMRGFERPRTTRTHSRGSRGGPDASQEECELWGAQMRLGGSWKALVGPVEPWRALVGPSAPWCAAVGPGKPWLDLVGLGAPWCAFVHTGGPVRPCAPWWALVLCWAAVTMGCALVWPGASCTLRALVRPGAPWFALVCHGVPWCALVRPSVPWCALVRRGACDPVPLL